MIQIIIGLLCGIGVYLILADLRKVPYIKTSLAIENLSKKQKMKADILDIWLEKVSVWLSGKIRLNEFKRSELEMDLRSAGIDISPEMFKSRIIVKSLLIGILSIPVYFVLPILSPVLLISAVVIYMRDSRSVSKRIHERRYKIEKELPRLVFKIEKTLKHSRDVIYMLDSYRQTAGKELAHELEITVADMKSGNIEAAITRLETRVSSSMMSDVCRGLIGIVRGDETEIYWASLNIKFSDIQRQRLRMEAAKIPRKVNRLSMCLLATFMVTYVVVILSQITESLGVLFG